MRLLCSCIAILLAGCSSSDRVAFTQQGLQELVNKGFLAPQICTMDMLPIMNVQLYLETPQIFLQGNGKPLMFHINGKLDADVFGGVVMEKVPLQVSGFTELRYSPEDQTIHMEKIDFMEANIDLEVAVFKAVIIDSFQKALQKELVNLPLIDLHHNQELASRLSMWVDKAGSIAFDVQNNTLFIEPGKQLSGHE